MAKMTIKILDDEGNDAGTVTGTPVVIEGYEQYSFLFCKIKEMKGYEIREVTTGLSVYPITETCKTKAEAVDTARQYLDILTISGIDVDEAVQEYLRQNNNGNPLNKVKTKQRRLL